MSGRATLALGAAQVRVLGVLVEKHLSTPEVYPLTLNALVTGCNQSSNRMPVTALTAEEVRAALDGLRSEHRLVRMIPAGGGSRTDKYRHVLDDLWQLSRPEAAVLAELLLRGAQTVGELRTRTERMHAFGSLAEVEAVVDRLCDPDRLADPAEAGLARETGMLRVSSPPEAPRRFARPWPGPLAVRLERQPGQKEGRIAHLLGELVSDQIAGGVGERAGTAASAHGSSTELEALRAELDGLRAELDMLRADLAELRRVLGSGTDDAQR